jgi:hypothetical protein
MEFIGETERAAHRPRPCSKQALVRGAARGRLGCRGNNLTRGVLRSGHRDPQGRMRQFL